MRNSFDQLLSNKKLLLSLSFIIIIIYFIPFFYLGENSHLLIHDNLDSSLYWVKLLLSSDNFFSPDQIFSQTLNGISRSSLNGTYEISLIWFKLFGIYYGYVFNKVVMSFCAFTGMYLLLEKSMYIKSTNTFILVGVSLLFALLPYWSFNLSVSGLPFVLWAFLNIREGKKQFIYWLLIIIFPFYSNLVLSGVFLIIILTLIFAYDSYKFKTINYSLILGIIVICILYVISHFPLFYTQITSHDYVSHRVEFLSR